MFCFEKFFKQTWLTCSSICKYLRGKPQGEDCSLLKYMLEFPSKIKLKNKYRKSKKVWKRAVQSPKQLQVCPYIIKHRILKKKKSNAFLKTTIIRKLRSALTMLCDPL